MKVGVVILLAEDAGRRAPRYTEIRERALQTEQAGFDSIWLYDHLIYRLPRMGQRGIWECWTMLSALAEATTRVEIGRLVVCTAFRNPAILAKMATTLDEVSGGRFILGLGAGWNKAEFEAFGLPFDHRGDRFEEALRIVVPLVREGSVDFHGAYHQAARCEIRPRGPRAEGPPLLIGAKGPRMLRLTAQLPDMPNRPASAVHRRGQDPGNPRIYPGEHVMSGLAVGFSPPPVASQRVKTRGWARRDVLPALKGGASRATCHLRSLLWTAVAWHCE